MDRVQDPWMAQTADASEPVAIRQAPAGATFRGGTARAGDYGPLAGGADGPYDWAHHTGAAIRSSPVVVGGLVYVGSFGGLHAVDAATGIPRWVHPTGGAVDASPAVSGGMVFVTSTDGVICALSADDGELQWAWDSGALASSSPAVVGDCVVIGGPASTVLALDAWSGDLRWTCRTGGDQVAGDLIGSQLLSPMDTSPAIIDGVVYINDSQLLALDLATGTVRWAAPVTTTATTSPAVSDGVVYTAELGGAICAVDAATGDVRWRSATRDVFFAFSTVAVVDDTVIACGQGSASGEQTGSDLDGGVVLALDATTGALRWRTNTSDPVLCSPAVSGDVAYVTETGTDLHLLAYAVPTGELQQRRKLGTAGSGQIVTSSPALAGGTLYVGLPDGRLIARPAASSSRSGVGRRLTAWWGPSRERHSSAEQSSDHLPAIREADDSEPTARPSARMPARRRAELQQLADHYATAAQAASERDDFDEAVGWSTRAVEVVEALCEAFPDAAEHKAVLAGQLYNRATMLDRAGDAERGAQDAQRALELYRERVPSDPGMYTPLALDAQSRLALLLAASGQNAEAREVGAAAVDEHRALAERYPGHEPGLARTLARYSEAMVRTGDQQRALAAGREVLELYRRRVGALGLDETLAFGRTAYNVATLLLPPTAQTAAEGWRAAADAVEQLTIVAQAGMGDAVEGARMLAEAFRATMDTG